MKIKRIKDLTPGDQMEADNGETITILSAQKAEWIKLAGGIAYDISYEIAGSKFCCIENGTDKVRLV